MIVLVNYNPYNEWEKRVMKCPNCTSVDLLMTERKGIEIDYCPTCRGVWLDRGELDKFIQQAEQQNLGRSSIAPNPIDDKRSSFSSHQGRYEEHDRRYENHTYDDRRYRDDDRPPYRYGKKKESFWGELFYFD